MRAELAKLRAELEDHKTSQGSMGMTSAVFKELLDTQAKVLAQAVKGGQEKRTSTNRIQPTYKPPVLGDEGKVAVKLRSSLIILQVLKDFWL